MPEITQLIESDFGSTTLAKVRRHNNTMSSPFPKVNGKEGLEMQTLTDAIGSPREHIKLSPPPKSWLRAVVYHVPTRFSKTSY